MTPLLVIRRESTWQPNTWQFLIAGSAATRSTSWASGAHLPACAKYSSRRYAEEVLKGLGDLVPGAHVAELRADDKPSDYCPSKPLPPDPKKIHGAGKPDLSLIPPVALHHMAMAFEDGGYKYGPFNWRITKVEARTYIAAGMRHLADYLDGAEVAVDSDVHNLGHAMACCAILLDAIEGDHLIDNRPHPGKSAEVLERLKEQKAEFREAERKQWSDGSKM